MGQRLDILEHLKNNNWQITYDDLVDIGVYKPGTLAEGGILRWLQNFDFGGPAHFADLLETEYRLNQNGTNFAQLDQAERERQSSERAMLIATMVGNLVDGFMTYTPGVKSPFGKGTSLENIEQFGTTGNFKTKTDYVAPPVIRYRPSSGVPLKANPYKTTTIISSYDKDMQYIIDELGGVKSTDFGAKKGGLNVLNVPDEVYNKDTFWDLYNKQWLDEAIKRGDDIFLATKPEGEVISYFDYVTRKEIITGFGREYNYLLEMNYYYDAATNMMKLK